MKANSILESVKVLQMLCCLFSTIWRQSCDGFVIMIVGENVRNALALLFKANSLQTAVHKHT
jgi:hypothetical protein